MEKIITKEVHFPQEKVRTRIAPSPTGSPHIGTAYTALFNFVFAKKNKGSFILRIEDTDRTRLVENSEKEIMQALEWLSLSVDEGPETDGKFGPYRQSERLSIYNKFALELVEKGKAYWCNCSSERLTKIREEQQARKEIPHYDRKCRYEKVENPEGAVVRLAVPLDGETVVSDKLRGEISFQNSVIDDQVLLKSDGYPTYHLASVVDDHLMEISHVIRAEEWLSSTPKHILIYQAFGWKIPLFVHLPLLRNPDRSKISKRKNPVSIDFYREEGYLPEALINFLGLMGWSMPDEREIFSLEEMIKDFTLERIDTAGPIFDVEKLNWINGHYIRSLPDKDLNDKLNEFSKFSEKEREKVLPLVKERLKRLKEFDQLTSYFFRDKIELKKTDLIQKSKTEKETKQVIKEVLNKLKETSWDQEKIQETLEKVLAEIEWSKTDLFQTVRAAVTGSKASPPLFETLVVVGKERTLKHLTQAEKELSD